MITEPDHVARAGDLDLGQRIDLDVTADPGTYVNLETGAVAAAPEPQLLRVTDPEPEPEAGG